MKHEVVVSVPEYELGRADTEFHVKKGGETVGKLKVSKGSVVWVPKDCTFGQKLAWTEFACVMQANGKPENGNG